MSEFIADYEGLDMCMETNLFGLFKYVECISEVKFTNLFRTHLQLWASGSVSWFYDVWGIERDTSGEGSSDHPGLLSMISGLGLFLDPNHVGMRNQFVCSIDQLPNIFNGDNLTLLTDKEKPSFDFQTFILAIVKSDEIEDAGFGDLDDNFA